MNTFIEIIKQERTKDTEGFAITEDKVLASVRAYREIRHGSERWANLAVFDSSTHLFRFRIIPQLEVTTDMFIRCDEKLYNINSAVDVNGRGMYVEVLAKEVEASG